MAPPPCSIIIGNHVPAAQEDAFEIVVDLPVEVFLRHFRRGARCGAADIVDEDVDTAELLPAGLGHRADCAVVEHIADMGRDLAVIADARHGFGHRFFIVVHGKDFGALAREQHRRGAPIAPTGPDTAGPGNERDFAFHPSRHRSSRLFAINGSGPPAAMPG